MAVLTPVLDRERGMRGIDFLYVRPVAGGRAGPSGGRICLVSEGVAFSKCLGTQSTFNQLDSGCMCLRRVAGWVVSMVEDVGDLCPGGSFLRELIQSRERRGSESSDRLVQSDMREDMYNNSRSVKLNAREVSSEVQGSLKSMKERRIRAFVTLVIHPSTSSAGLGRGERTNFGDNHPCWALH